MISLFIAAVLFLPLVKPPAAQPAEALPPPVVENIATHLARFPYTADEIAKNCRRADTYVKWMGDKQRMGASAARWYAEEIAVAKWVRDAWHLLRGAHDNRFDDGTAHTILELLCKHIGGDWYERGLMPPPAPEWWRDPGTAPANLYGR